MSDTPSVIRLVVVIDGEFHAYPLARGKHLLGRGSQADLVIDDHSISREHALLWVGSDQRLTLEDQESRNGTWVGDRRLVSKASCDLRLVQRFRLGAIPAWIERVQRKKGPQSRTDFVGGTRRETAPELPAESPPLVIESEAMRTLYRVLDDVAMGEINVLVVGETGVGKEVAAAELHKRSKRANKPFMAINCAALPENLFESQLFGHEQGAFTGATTSRVGLIEQAYGGTVFLDEVGELPLVCQAKLLRAIAQREVLPMGASSPRPVDVRFVTATNRDLQTEVARGQFREDLFYRLNAMTLRVPPLRQRTADIEPLARQFMESLATRAGRNAPRLGGGALEILQRYPWPGNVRELRNVIARSVLLCKGDVIESEGLLIGTGGPLPGAADDAGGSETATISLPGTTGTGAFHLGSMKDALKVIEDQRRSTEHEKIVEALSTCGGNQSQAAKLLGISRSSLIRRMKRYDIPRPRGE